ncbi:hypothetical protein JG688_00016046 [Phytophthora aleatoria]|uniref:DUF1279 domain-containing protein n=1 Tax=Phytophthora aleatoria TaxID=2496075 RepID=A0A8J5I920_9STRA|nr:hypothetical protein JG688_00016046 [Phytophthora aleatoria]
MISRVKHVFKRYGRTAFIFHSTIFVTTLAGSYAAIQRGVDLQALAKRVPILDCPNSIQTQAHSHWLMCRL